MRPEKAAASTPHSQLKIGSLLGWDLYGRKELAVGGQNIASEALNFNIVEWEEEEA